MMVSSGEQGSRRAIETIEGATIMEKGESLAVALRGLKEIYAEEARENSENDSDDIRSVEEVIVRCKEIFRAS